ncbi:hypothetical protein Syun_000948 [Stephania yunnanensis]|uniref:Uncharacterized protein n=1 Tax=Stephania yunnanensis TaxID=152371 RepID=A0AAP0LCV5_9MAGN
MYIKIHRWKFTFFLPTREQMASSMSRSNGEHGSSNGRLWERRYDQRPGRGGDQRPITTSDAEDDDAQGGAAMQDRDDAEDDDQGDEQGGDATTREEEDEGRGR